MDPIEAQKIYDELSNNKEVAVESQSSSSDDDDYSSHSSEEGDKQFLAMMELDSKNERRRSSDGDQLKVYEALRRMSII